MAPEQWRGAPASTAADIYAATAVFFECLTGKAPFSGPLAQLATQHEQAAVPADLIEEPLRPLVARGMAEDPAARPASAADFVAELAGRRDRGLRRGLGICRACPARRPGRRAAGAGVGGR
jgi:eukaryotic-like serine/threonine-protein kinase